MLLLQVCISYRISIEVFSVCIFVSLFSIYVKLMYANMFGENQ